MKASRSSSPRADGPRRRLIYCAVWALLALPLPISLWLGFTGNVLEREDMVRGLGLWGVRILIAGLALTPLARLLRRPILLRYRRTFGMWGFTYAALHGPYFFYFGRLWEMPPAQWAQRPYFALGIASLILLVPLAITSTDAMIRRLGPAGWRRLHRSVYPAMILISLHGIWQRSIDHRQPAIYVALVGLLLVIRLPPVMRALMARTQPRASSIVPQSTPV